MRSRPRITLAVLSLVMLTPWGAFALRAQEPAPSAPVRKAYDPARRLPAYFGQIGLTPEEREAIYKIQARDQKKISELQKQIADTKAHMLAESEGVLTDAQKQLLDYRRKAASTRAPRGDETATGSAPAATLSPAPGGSR